MRTLLVAALLTAAVSSTHAQPTAATSASQVVATIDGVPITAAEAQREFDRAFGKAELKDGERRHELARALDQVIDRKLALRRLSRMGKGASQADVDLAFARLMKQLADQNIKPAEHYQRIGLTEAEVRQHLLWALSWQKYLAELLADDNVARYFEKNRRDFDGTQLRVAHILLKVDGDEPAVLDAARTKAVELREAIAAGKLTFADAARQHSRGPSAEAGGDIGWIERHEPMPEAFSRAAFALSAGEMSPPVVTTFGVHLIQVTEIKAGQGTWKDCVGELKAAMTRHVFRWLADQERPEAKVERVREWP